MLKRLTATILAALVGTAIAGPEPYFMEMPIDHKNESMGTFKLQYIVNDEYYKNDTGLAADLPKPIFFYTGNEGSVWDFYHNSGFMTTTLAKQFGALVVFAEHRYFGQSWPFRQEYALSPGYNTYLTIEQTMADYVDVLNMVKQKYDAKDQATIAFGGSYGGMLAAWMRMKYPHVIQGSLAASAPILLFQNASNLNEGYFSEIVSNDYNVSGKVNDSCWRGINNAFKELISKAPLPGNFSQNVSKSFKTCQNMTSGQDVRNLTDLLRNGFFYMAMTDYPYAASFLNNMPANPVNVSCKAFESWTPDTDDQATLDMLADAAKVYFNWGNDTDFCYDISDTSGTGTLAASGWDVLACNQLAMIQTNGNANTSIFTVEDDVFDPDQYTQDCQDRFGLTPDFTWAMDTFGGSHNYQQEYRQYSKIIFSNGNLDPWLAGGVSGYVSPKLPTYIIKGGAHHLDLRLPNEADPEAVTWVREQETRVISEWVREYQPDWHGFTLSELEEQQEQQKKKMYMGIAQEAVEFLEENANIIQK